MINERTNDPLVAGDDRLLGVNQRVDPALVPPGYASDATNMEFRDGIARPRRGMVPLISTNRLGAVWPWVWPVFWNTVVPFGVIHRAETFSDPNGVEWLIIAADNKVYRTRQGTNAREIPLPPDVVVGAGVDFVQCFNVLVMFRGAGAPPLVMNSFAAGFQSITQLPNDPAVAGQNPVDGTQPIPNGVNGINFANRLLVVHGRDFVAVSDVLNYTRYAPQLADFRITQGTADGLVALYKFNDSTLLCFKEQSVVYIANVLGDLSEVAQVPLTSEYGCAAPDSVVGVGADVWFLSTKGIATVRQTEQNKLQSTSGQVSDPVEPTIKRINWRFASGAQAMAHDGFVYFALPLDEAKVTVSGTVYSGVNNAILVYDVVNAAWAGVWSGQGVMVKNFVKFENNGKRIIGFASADGYLVAMNHGLKDRVRGVPTVIGAQLVTRGYSAPGEDWLKFREVEMDLATHGPTATVAVRTEGVENLDATEFAITRSRTRYFQPFDRQDWVASNDNNDFLTPHREDYAVALTAVSGGGGALWTADSATVTADSAVYKADGSGPGGGSAVTGMRFGTGIRLELHQRTKQAWRVNEQGRYLQVVLAQQGGQTRVHGVAVKATEGRRRKGLIA